MESVCKCMHTDTYVLLHQDYACWCALFSLQIISWGDHVVDNSLQVVMYSLKRTMHE